MKPFNMNLICVLVYLSVLLMQVVFPKGVSSGALLSVPLVIAVLHDRKLIPHIIISCFIVGLTLFFTYSEQIIFNWEWLLLDKFLIVCQILAISYIAKKFRVTSNKLFSLEHMNSDLKKRIARY